MAAALAPGHTATKNWGLDPGAGPVFVLHPLGDTASPRESGPGTPMEEDDFPVSKEHLVFLSFYFKK